MGQTLLQRAALFFLVAALTAIGLSVQFSVSESMGIDLAGRQLRWCGVSLAAMAMVVLIPYHWWMRHAYLVYGACLGLLALVPLIGVTRNNSRRWIEFGISIQPSEIMKIAFILVMARLLRFRDLDAKPATLLVPGLFFAIPTMMIFAQPDLGTALIFGPVALAMLFCSGLAKRQMAAILGSGVFFAVVGYLFFLKPYQQTRILSTLFRDRLSTADRLVEGYQLEQALRSIGIGGFWGQGLGDGLQNQMNALPYRHNDFIYSVVAEELGFFGSASVIVLILCLVAVMLRIGIYTRDPAARLIAVGVATLVAFQSFVHIGVNIGVVPTTGMTLPFVSAGGTSLLTFSVAVAIVMNLSRRSAFVFGADPRQEHLERLRRL